MVVSFFLPLLSFFRLFFSFFALCYFVFLEISSITGIATLTMCLQAVVANKRLKDFLVADELDLSSIDRSPTVEGMSRIGCRNKVDTNVGKLLVKGLSEGL